MDTAHRHEIAAERSNLQIDNSLTSPDTNLFTSVLPSVHVSTMTICPSSNSKFPMEIYLVNWFLFYFFIN